MAGKPNMTDRARAARCLIDTMRSQEDAEDAELAAFMAIFHPERGAEANRKIVRDRRSDITSARKAGVLKREGR